MRVLHAVEIFLERSEVFTDNYLTAHERAETAALAKTPIRAAEVGTNARDVVTVRVSPESWIHPRAACSRAAVGGSLRMPRSSMLSPDLVGIGNGSPLDPGGGAQRPMSKNDSRIHGDGRRRTQAKIFQFRFMDDQEAKLS